MPLKIIAALEFISCPPEVGKKKKKKKAQLRILREVHTGLWDLRKEEKEWLSKKAKLPENLPKDMQKHILNPYLKATSK